MNHLLLIWKGLWRKPVRTALTYASMTVAFLLFCLLNGINQGLDHVSERFHLDRLYVMNRISMYHPLILPFAQQVEKIPGVEDIAYWAYFVGYYQRPTVQLPIVAADVKRMFRMYPELRLPREQLQAMEVVKSGAVISKSLARRFGWKIGDRVPIKSAIWPRKDGSDIWNFDIVGIYEPAEASPALNDLFFVNLDQFDEARAFGAGQVHLMIVRVKDQSRSGAIARQIDEMAENSPLQTRTRSENAYAAVQWRQINDLRLVGNFIIGAVLFTLLVVSASTMMQSVRQRFAELAVLMTLGFTPLRIAGLILGEAVLLSLLAAATGLGLAALAFPSVAELFGAMRMQPGVFLGGLAIALGVAAVSALLPIVRAMRLSLAAALSGR
ncbi:ABC transporter permease [Lysobacter enzymogenes]|uniref:ABC transporter permease n=2 Tax=Bacteria TaxID=2 RepID=A0AAU9AH85_LYSEN|nr:ABC transporter permease [Lysobacter enzymogenes]BAV97994.1 ABC transporter permease [Lysobacter enzymogenes]